MLRKFIAIQLLLLVLALSSNSAPGLSNSKYSLLVPNYDLEVELLPDARQIEVKGSVQLPAIGNPQEIIPVLLSDEMRDFRVEVVLPASSAGKATVEAKGKVGNRAIYAISPIKPIPVNERVLLRFSYSGGEKGGFVFHLGPEGSFAHGMLGGWYPLFDAGDVTGHVGNLKFIVPPRHVVIASGESLSTMQEMAQGEYRFEVSRPAVFSFAAATYTIARRTDNPRIAAYLLHARPNIDAYLDKCSKVLGVLERQFGRFPTDELSLVEIPSEYAAGFFGASSPGIIFVPGKFLDAEFDYSLHGHELSHQWWGGSIGTKGSKGGFMLSEGMAQFGSLITVESLQGPDAAQGYRQTGYPSIGKYDISTCEGKSVSIQSLRGYLMLTSTGGDQKLDSLTGDLAHSLAVSKGFLVLDLLSRTVGQAKFSKILAKFTQQHSYGAVTWEEFLGAIDAGTGRDMKWFYEQWFERTGVPDLDLTWNQKDNEVHGVITQTEPLYLLSVEIRAVDNSGKKRVLRTVEIRNARTEFVLPVDFKVRSIQLDPQFFVPHWTPDYRAESEEIKRCSAKQ